MYSKNPNIFVNRMILALRRIAYDHRNVSQNWSSSRKSGYHLLRRIDFDLKNESIRVFLESHTLLKL